jgi:hypothetical protein
MHLTNPASRVLRYATFVLSVAAILSCQSTSPAPTPEGKATYTAAFTINDEYKKPESVVTRQGTDTVRAAMQVKGNEFTASVELASAPSGPIGFQLYRAGVQIGELTYHYAGDRNTKLVYDGATYNGIALEILRRIQPSTSSVRFDSALAAALVAGDRMFDTLPYPANAPVGLDTAHVTKLIMLELVASKKNLSELAKTWSLKLDTMAVKAQIRILFAAGTIKDTSTLLPPPADRQGPTISIETPATGTVLAQGQDSVAVKASVTDASGVDSVWIDGRMASKVDNFWTTGKVRIPSGDSWYEIVVRALDRAGNSSETSVRARKAGGVADTTGPVVEIYSPAAGTVLPSTQDSIEVQVLASDRSGVDSVWIAGRRATKRDSIWSAGNVYVPVSMTGTEILVRCVDGRGNPSTAVRNVKREAPADPTGARTRVVTPAAGVPVPFDSASVIVGWIVDDPRAAVVSAWFGGVPATLLDDSVWTLRVALLPTGVSSILPLKAVNAKGDSTFGSVSLVRAKDAIAPVLSAKFANPDTVGFDTLSTTLSWKATDNHELASVRIDDSLVTGIDATYSTSVRLKIGSNVVRIVAADSTGNQTRDSAIVVRTKDANGPVLERLVGTKDSAVDFDTLGISVAWKVRDNHKLDSVRIGDSLVAGVDGIYSRRVGLAAGPNTIRIMAADSTGNRSWDSVVVVRSKDVQAPKAVRATGTADMSVPYLTQSVSVGWKVSDNLSVQSVTIGGKPVTTTDSVYSSTVALVVGRNVIRMVAADAAGNAMKDSVVVVRANHDSIAPVIVRADALTSTRTVLNNIKTATVSWKVTDASPLTVIINDSAVTAVAGIYTRTVSLAVGTNKIRVRATDTAKNVVWDSIQITRSPLDSFAAVWRVDSTSQSVLVDQSGHGLDLKLSETGKWTRAFDSTLVPTLPSGKILYTAKVFMTSYPDSTIYNKVAVVVGFYEGIKMAVSVSGQLMVAGQKSNAGSNTWYGPRSINGAVPLNKWTTLAVGADQATGEFYAWIDGVAVQLYSSKTVAGTKVRVAASTFALGADATDGQKFTGRIAEVKVINKFIYGAGLAVGLEACIENLCAKSLTPNAFWKPDSVNQATLTDKSGRGLSLTKVSTGIWSRAFDTSLAAQLPTGRILYTTQVKLSAYPASTIYNKAAVIMGFYEGMKMMVTTTGQVIVAGQRGTPTANTWYGPRTVAGAVPLNRWVTLAVGTDQATGEFYAWIDGLPQRLYSATTVAGTKIRVATSQFGLGADLTDGQKFEGQIGEVKVWNNFIYGPGLTVGLDPTIEK